MRRVPGPLVLLLAVSLFLGSACAASHSPKAKHFPSATPAEVLATASGSSNANSAPPSFPFEWPYCPIRTSNAHLIQPSEKNPDARCSDHSATFTPCAGGPTLHATLSRCCQLDASTSDQESYSATCTTTLDISDDQRSIARVELPTDTVSGNSVEGDFQSDSDELTVIDLGAGIQALAHNHYRENLGGMRTRTLALFAHDAANAKPSAILERTIHSAQSTLTLLDERIGYEQRPGHVADLLIDRSEWDEQREISVSSQLRLHFREGAFQEEPSPSN